MVEPRQSSSTPKKKKAPAYSSDFGAILDQVMSAGQDIVTHAINQASTGNGPSRPNTSGPGSALAALGLNIDMSKIDSGSGSAASRQQAPPSVEQMLVGTSMDVT